MTQVYVARTWTRLQDGRSPSKQRTTKTARLELAHMGGMSFPKARESGSRARFRLR